MPKDTFYFPHDYNARANKHIKALLQKHGILGYGIWWAIVEDLYNNANALPTHYGSIAYDLRVDESVIKSVIEDFDLFIIDGNEFYSDNVQRRLDERNNKTVKAKESALKRWNKCERNANAMQSQSEGNAIKEKKGKEIKEDISSIEQKKQKFTEGLKPFVDEFGKELCNDFYRYWTESNSSKTKMRFESEKFFDMKRRLITWRINSEKAKK
jgi:chemotaxis protein histidine kinase CheA